MLKKGILVPIPKGNKDPMVRGNNRGITLLPFLNKLYQNLLKERVDNSEFDFVDEVQGAGRKNISCLHTSLLLREAIHCNRDQGKNVYVCLLDVQKAFDCVWTNGMLYKLNASGIDMKFWRIVKNMYVNFRCCVRVMSEYSFWFNVSQGVQQGAPLSMFLYQLFVNDMLCELRDSRHGARVEDINITCPAYADDVALIATTECDMQNMLNIVNKHSRKWRYKFNASKSEIVFFGSTKKKCDFYIGKEKVAINKRGVHLGTVISSDIKQVELFVKEKVYKARKTLTAVKGLGSKRVPLNTVVMSKIYWSVCVPIISYGVEVMPMETGIRSCIESAHWAIGKDIQKLPQNTPNPCVLPQLGWLSMNSYIDLNKLLFLWRILLMNTTSIFRKVVIKRIHMWSKKERKTTGPVCECLNVAAKYNVLIYVVAGMNDGIFMSISEWKRLVKGKIQWLETAKHNVTISMYKKSNLFVKCIDQSKMWPWYTHASRYPEMYKLCITMMRLLVGVELENERRNVSSYCICCADKLMCAAHILFECPVILVRREISWEDVCSNAPQNLINDICKMNIEDRTCFILNGMNSRYLPEFAIFYNAVMRFVNVMIDEYKTFVHKSIEM